MQEMTVHGVNFDPQSGQTIVILKTAHEARFLPICIGQFEAAAIIAHLQGLTPPRPMTHDLTGQIIEHLAGRLLRVAVVDFVDSTFYARLTLSRNGSEIEVDARPSDAIALALRAGAPIYAAAEVLEAVGVSLGEPSEPIDEAQVLEEFHDFLDHVRPEDFGQA